MTKNKSLRLVVTEGQHAALQQAADAAGQSLSAFIRDAAGMRAHEHGIDFPRNLAPHGDANRFGDSMRERRILLVRSDGTWQQVENAPAVFAARLSHPVFPVSVYFTVALDEDTMRDIAHDAALEVMQG